MSTAFREIPDRGVWHVRVAGVSPFMTAEWEDEITRAFPYVRFRYFIYNETHAVRLAEINNRLTTVPFSDGGDVIALGEHTLDLEAFRRDVLAQFGTSVALRVHSAFAPAQKTESIKADILDFRIPLVSFGSESIRKTLRHIVGSGLEDGMEIRRALPEDMKRVYKLYLQTMHEAASVALPRSTFDHFNFDDIFVCTINGKIRCASVFVTGDVHAHYFISASDSIGKRHNAGHHLLFYALMQYKQAGKEAVFLGGVNAESSLRTFKEGWRGEQCFVYTVDGDSHHETARRLPIRSLWKLIPSPIRKLGPASLIPFATKIVGRWVF